MSDLFEMVIITILVLFLAIGATLGILYPIERASCYAKTEGIGMAADFSFLGGCRVQHSGNWIPLKNYRLTEVK